jgi:hypothetical protein
VDAPCSFARKPLITSPNVALTHSPADLKLPNRRLYTAASTQEDVFRNEVAHLVTGSLSGRSGSVFTYGVAGAGKTHSMFGKDDGMAKEVGKICDPSMVRRRIADHQPVDLHFSLCALLHTFKWPQNKKVNMQCMTSRG